MSSIDERVVELQFDNGQFESGVQTSLSTLDKLKKALNLEGAAKGLDGIQASGNKFSLSNVADNVQTVADRFSVLGIIGDQVLRNITNSALNMGRNLLTAIPNQIISGGKARAQNIEQAQFMLKGLMKESYDWDTIYKDLDYAVSGTAYGIDAAAKVASQLKASNVDFGDKMKDALRGVSGVAAMTNSSYEEIGQIFTTVAGQGKVMTMQLRQLESRGLNVAATLGEALGKTEAEVRDMVTKGKIDFETFADAMNTAFGEHATKANETFSGSLSNIKASLSRMGAKFATPTYDHLKDIFNHLLPVMKAIEKLLNPIAEKYTKVADAATTAVNGILDSFGAVLGVEQKTETSTNGILKGVQKVNQLYEERKSKLLAAFGLETKTNSASEKANKSLTEKINDTANAIKGVFSQTKKPDNGVYNGIQKINTLYEERKKTLLDLFGVEQKTESKFTKIYGTISKVNTKISSLTSGIFGQQEKTNGILRGVQKINDIYEERKNKLKELLGLEKDTSSEAQKTGEELVDVESLANDVINGMYGNGEERKKALDELGLSYSVIQNKVNELLGVEKRHEVTEEDLAKMTKKTTEATNESGEALEKVSETRLDKLLNSLMGLGSAIKIIRDAGVAIWENVIKPIGSWGLNLLLDGILTVTSALGKEITKLETKLSGSNFFDNITKNIVPNLKKAKNDLFQFVQSVGKLEGVQRLGESLKNLGKSIQGLAMSGFGKLSSSFSGFITSISNFKFNKNGGGLLGFIDSVAGKISDFINSLLSGKNVIEEFKNVFGKKDSSNGILEGVSKTKDKIEEINKSFEKLKSGDGLLQRITKTISKLTGKIKSFKLPSFNLDFLGTGVNSTLDGLKKKLSELDLGKILGGVQAGSLAFGAIQLAKFFKSLSGGVKSVSAIPKNAAKMLSSISSAIKAYELDLKADTLLKIAEAIGVLAASIVALSFVDSKTLAAVTVDLMLIIGVIGGIMIAIAKVSKGASKDKTQTAVDSLNTFFDGLTKAFSKGAKLAGFGIMVAGIASAVYTISKAVKTVEEVNWEKGDKGCIRLLAILASLVAAGLIMSKFGSDFNSSIGGGFTLMALAIKILASALEEIGSIPDDILYKGAYIAAGFMALFTVMSYVSSFGNSMLSLSAGILVLSIALAALAPSILLYSNIKWTTFISGFAKIAVIGLVLGAIASFAASALPGAAAMVVLAAAILLITPALLLLGVASKAGWEGVKLLAATFTLLSVAAAVATGLAPGLTVLVGTVSSVAKSMLSISGAVALFGAALYILTGGISFLLDHLPGIGSKLIEIGKDVLLWIGGLIKDVAAAIRDNGVEILQAVIDGVDDIVNWITSDGLSMVGYALLLIWKVVSAVIFKIPFAIGKRLIEAIIDALPTLLEGLKSATDYLSNAVAILADHIILSILNKVRSSNGILRTIFDALGLTESLDEQISIFEQDIEERTSTVTKTIEEGAEQVEEANKDFEEALTPEMSLENTMAGSTALVYQKEIPEAISEGKNEVEKASDDYFGSLLKSFDGQGSLEEYLGDKLDLSNVDLGNIDLSSLTDNLPEEIKDSVDLSSLNDMFKDAGQESGGFLSEGLGLGIGENSGIVYDGAGELGENVIDKLNEALGVASPSTKAIEAGDYVDQGLALGLHRGQAPIKAAIVFLTTTLISNLIKAVPKMKTAGTTAGLSYAAGILSKASAASSAGTVLSSSALSGLNRNISSAKSLGEYFGSAFASGVSSKVQAAYSAGSALGKAAEQGERSSTKTSSPSKVAMGLGEFWGEGFVIGLTNMAYKAKKAGASMGDDTLEAMRSPLKIINNLLDGDIDMNPTIRPVMDLSDVRSGVKKLGGLLPQSQMNFGILSSAFNNRIDNGNADIVAAINSLKGATPTGDTININGITYDDGSNIASTIKTLVKAARVERRR